MAGCEGGVQRLGGAGRQVAIQQGSRAATGTIKRQVIGQLQNDKLRVHRGFKPSGKVRGPFKGAGGHDDEPFLSSYSCWWAVPHQSIRPLMYL
eukprot:1148236-Pelagomonas_calceolata.AAC.4